MMDNRIHKISVQMRYSDLDALGHVNNAIFLSYMELGRTGFIKEILNGFKTERVNFVINHAEIDFKSPIRFNDNPTVLTWISKVGNTSCVFSHLIKGEEDGKFFSSGKTVVVWIDQQGKKVDIDPEIKSKLISLLEDGANK